MYFHNDRVYAMHARLLRFLAQEKLTENVTGLFFVLSAALIIVKQIEDEIRLDMGLSWADVRFIVELEKLLL